MADGKNGILECGIPGGDYSLTLHMGHAKAWTPNGVGLASPYFGENVLATGVYAGSFFGS